MGVLDSGATHPVRPRRKEDKVVRTLKVELAERKEVVMEVNENEVLMGAVGTQVIVPMVAIVKELNCQIRTTKENIPIFQRTGSPLIPEEVCLELSRI